MFKPRYPFGPLIRTDAPRVQADTHSSSWSRAWRTPPRRGPRKARAQGVPEGAKERPFNRIHPFGPLIRTDAPRSAALDRRPGSI